MNWYACCKYIQRNDPDASFMLQDDGAGVYIRSWSSVEPQPTEQELAAVEADALVWYEDKVKTDKSEMDHVDTVVKALALVLLDEINLLRAEHSLAARTTEHLKTAIKNKL